MRESNKRQRTEKTQAARESRELSDRFIFAGCEIDRSDRPLAAFEWGGIITEFTLTSADPQPGDFDADGTLSALDIDALSVGIRDGNMDPRFDLNDDAAINQDDHRVWVKELANSYFGDANLDGEFNSSDLIGVFQAGVYEDKIAHNATWASGDWNGDGDFESGDLVAAFQDGGYELGPRAAVSAVPEPSSAMLLALGIIGLCRIQRCR